MAKMKTVTACVVLLAMVALLAACGGGEGSGQGGPDGPGGGPRPQVQNGPDPSAADKIRNDVAKNEQKLRESNQKHQDRINANQAEIEARGREQAAQQSIDKAKSVLNDPSRPTP